mmetsp:Transcript_83718/g.157618  ORF Transcript_83718/g.157618 Transcript_83718/m.157618 type:complete len:214 (-) Transcript_83718:4113-4754(-)
MWRATSFPFASICSTVATFESSSPQAFSTLSSSGFTRAIFISRAVTGWYMRTWKRKNVSMSLSRTTVRTTGWPEGSFRVVLNMSWKAFGFSCLPASATTAEDSARAEAPCCCDAEDAGRGGAGKAGTADRARVEIGVMGAATKPLRYASRTCCREGTASGYGNTSGPPAASSTIIWNIRRDESSTTATRSARGAASSKVSTSRLTPATSRTSL